MHRWTSLFVAVLIILAAAIGCSGGNGSPVTPLDDNGLTEGISHEGQSQTQLWGYYDVYMDIQSQTVEAVVNRNAMFSANVVTFLNNNPAGLSFHINGTPTFPDRVDVDIDVSITHPLPGMTQYNGYDVRGIFVANGSTTFTQFSTKLKYAKSKTDQTLNNADGYSRWFNPVEFTTPGLFGYKPGNVASKGYTPTATLNPYKYFADGLTATGDLWAFLNVTPDTHRGKFVSGSKNTRNYLLSFPIPTPGVKFAYAVLADWKGELPADHPANTEEAVALSVGITPDVYYASSSVKGGSLKLDINVFDWGASLSAGAMEEYDLIVSSNVLSAKYTLSSTEMIPTGGGVHYSTYYTEIPATNVTSTAGNEFWVIVEYPNANYKNTFGVTNGAGNDKLAAFFRYSLYVSSTKYNTAPVINFIDDDIAPTDLNTTVYITDTAVTYSADVTDTDGPVPVTLTWYIEDGTATVPSDPPDTMPYDWSGKAIADYNIFVKAFDGDATTTGGPYVVHRGNIAPTVTGIVDNIIPTGDLNWAVDKSATAVTYTANYTDPDPGQTYSYSWYIEPATATDPTEPPDTMPFNWSTKTIGSYKIWVKVFDGFDTTQAGPYSVSYVDGWARGNFGGTTGMNDLARSSYVDSQGNVVFVGMFSGTGVDFDPGPGTTLLSSFNTTSYDVFVVKLNHAGVLLWARAFGDALNDEGRGVWIDGSNNIYVSGQFTSISFDADPGVPVVTISNTQVTGGTYDAFLSKFDANGTFQWCKTWGGILTDNNQYVWGDAANSRVYMFGAFASVSIDLDPNVPVVTALNANVAGGSTDPFLVRLDYSGNYQLGLSWGGTGGDLISDCTADNTGAFYVDGNFSGTCDFDPSGVIYNGVSNGVTDCYITKFTPAGAWVWTRYWGGPATDTAIPLDWNTSVPGYVYCAGTFTGIVDFDPGAGVTSRDAGIMSNDAYILRYDLNGTFDPAFAAAYGGPVLQIGQPVGATYVYLENINDMMLLPTGGFAVTGGFGSSTCDADPSANSTLLTNAGASGTIDGFTIAFDSAGKFSWANPTNGTGADIFMRIFCVQLDGDIYSSGYHGTGIVDFDPGAGVYNLTGFVNTDALIVKYKSNGLWY